MLINRHTASAWCPTFSKKDVSGEVGFRLLEEFPPTLNWRLTKKMPKGDFRRLLEIVRDSGPGKDGLPYSAWRAAGEFGLDILFQAAQALASGELPPAWFNDSLMIFAPKKESEIGSKFVTCGPLETRPLTLRNTCNKIIFRGDQQQDQTRSDGRH